MSYFKKLLPGITITFSIALISWYIGKAAPIIGGPVIAIISGITIAYFFKLPDVFSEGLRFTSKKILQLSIILLGFQMDLFKVIRIGGQSLILTIVTISASFITAYYLSKKLSIEGKTSVLIGVGTAICGGSAIAATAPVINANDEEVSSAISTIFMFNIIAVLIFPPIGRLMSMTDISFGMWAGTAINDTSSVVAAGQVWSDNALQLATIVKLARTLMILPITMILSIYWAKKENGNGKYRFARIFPWFVLGFILASVSTTINLVPDVTSAFIAKVGKFLIIAAMSAIGLNTNLKKLVTNGVKSIVLGLACWFSVAATSIFIQKIMHIW